MYKTNLVTPLITCQCGTSIWALELGAEVSEFDS